MAGIGWLAVLQLVPWSDVIKNAPKAADGAKKLWQSVRKKAPTSFQDTTTRSLPSVTPGATCIFSRVRACALTARPSPSTRPLNCAATRW